MKKRLLFCLTLIMLCFGIKNANAAIVTYTWTGAANNNWNNAFNWSSSPFVFGGYPGSAASTDEVVIAINATIIYNATTANAIHSISISSGKTVSLTFSGSDVLTFANNASASPTGAYISVGSSATLSLLGTGSIVGTSNITTGNLAILSSVAAVPITAASITAVNSTLTFNGQLTLSGNTTINYPGTTILTTNAANNAIANGVTVNYNGANIGNLTWNGSGTTTVGASGGASNIYAGCTFTVGSGNRITFNSNANFNSYSNLATTLASLVNSGSLTFAGCNLTGSGFSSSGSTNTYVTNNSTGVITFSGTGSKLDVPSYLNVSNSGTITANSGCSISMGFQSGVFTNNSGGTVNLTGGASGAVFNMNSNPTTLTNNGTMNFTAGSSLALNQPNASATNTSNMSFDASSISLTANPCSFTNTSTGSIGMQNVSAISLSGSNSTFNSAGTINLTSTAFATPTTVTLSSNPASFTSSGTMYATYTTINLNAANTIFKNDIGGALYLTSCGVNMTVNPTTFTNNAVMTATSTPFLMSGQNAAFNNNSGASVAMTACPFTLSGGTCTFNNSGTVQASGGSNFILNNNSGSSINNNAGSIQISGSTINLGINTSYLNNSATFTATLCNFTTNTSGSNGVITNNSTGTFNAIGDAFTLSTQGGAISNAGTFAATASGATPTTFNLNSTSSPGANITNTSTGTFNVGLDNSASTITLGSTGANTITNNNTFTLGPLTTIYMTSGSAKVTNTAGTFTFTSTALGTASTGPLASGASCVGNFTVQRYMPGGAGYRGYRLITLPVNINNIVSQTSTEAFIDLHSLNGGLITAGPGSGFSYPTATTNPLMYLYDESRAQNLTAYVKGKNVGIYSMAGSPGYNVIYYPAGSSATPAPTANAQVPVGNSIQTYFVGPYVASPVLTATAPAAATTSATGYLNQGTIPVYIFPSTSSKVLSYSPLVNTLPAQGLGLNQVGNPYPSTIDLDSVYYDNKTGVSAIGPMFYELKEPNNTFVAYSGNHTTSSVGAEAYIASGQGFFVQAISATSALTFYENEKVNVPLGTSTSPVLILSQRAKSMNSVTGNSISAAEVLPGGLAGLHLQITKDTATYTQTGIYFNSAWSDKYTPTEDAIDLDGPSPKIFLSSYSVDGARLCINQLGDYSKGKIIKLFASGTASGTYTISLADMKNIDQLYNVYLRDHKLNDSVNLRTVSAYNFTIVTSDTTTFGANRFDLVLERKALPPYQLLSFAGQKINRGVQLNWAANNAGNYTGFILEKQVSGNNFTPIYTIQSDSSTNYSFIDKNPVIGNNIYRLAQNDINGNVTYSSLITIGYNSISSNGFFDIFPNPAKDIMNISLNSITSADLSYTADIYNTSGVLMDHRSLNTNTWTEDVSAYKEGVYIIELKSTKGDTLGKSKFIKVK